MKKMIMMAMMMAMTITANAMSYTTAKNEALFLSDKMAYELNLTAAQYEAVYEINLDYLMNVNGRNDAYGRWWDHRNTDLKYVLTARQYKKYVNLNYFYRPIVWEHNGWKFTIYNHYSNRNHYYNDRPKAFGHYKGGNSHSNHKDLMARNNSHGHSNNSGHVNSNNSGRSNANNSGHSNGRGDSYINTHANNNKSSNANAHRSVNGGSR